MKPCITLVGMLAAAAMLAAPLSPATAGDLFYGCCSRPACGKMCKLVFEMKTLTATGYGYNCKEICLPGPSCRGCQHCDTVCCCNTPEATKGCPPKIEFCWYDWCARGCACPREVKVLTKFQAERKICWYHWEVVDGCTCNCGAPGDNCNCIFKPVADDAQIGAMLAISDGEQVELASWMTTDSANRKAQLAQAFNVEGGAATSAVALPTNTNPPAKADDKPSLTNRFSSLFKLGK